MPIPATVETAAILVIGDEILSGRTQDRNVATIARAFGAHGVEIAEVRVVRDDEAAIVEAVRALSGRYDLLLTTGGIGPTHDDVTTDAVAAAFGRGLIEHPEALAALQVHLDRAGRPMNASRRRMARVPEGADLIPNPVSGAPGFVIANVCVLAGIPAVMEAMLGWIVAQFEARPEWASATIAARGFGEGDIAAPLREIADQHGDVRIGSYPYFDGERYTTRIVIRGREGRAVEAAASATERMLDGLQAETGKAGA